jgi:hypothetical protein
MKILVRWKKKTDYQNIVLITCIQGFKKWSRLRLGYVKVFAISVSTCVTTLITAVAVWINHNLFFYIKKGNNGNGIDTCRNCFVAVVFTVAPLFETLIVTI